MFARFIPYVCLGSSLILPVVALADQAGDTVLEKAKVEKQIQLEKQKLQAYKKKLDALNLKLGDKKPKQKKAEKSSAKNADAANDGKVKSPWAGSNAQLGLVLNTGNTETTNFSGGLNLIYKKNRWSNTAQLQMQLNRSQGQVTKERYYGQDQVQYSFSKERKNFVYGTVNFTNDRFSPYEYQVISSAGYGRDLIKTSSFTLNLQGGPGVRYDDVRGQKQDNMNFIFYTASNLNWQMTKNMSLSEQLQYTIGDPFNYLQSVTALTNKLTGNLALQLSYTMQYYSKIPLGSTNTKNLDTITNIAVVYNF